MAELLGQWCGSSNGVLREIMIELWAEGDGDALNAVSSAYCHLITILSGCIIISRSKTIDWGMHYCLVLMYVLMRSHA